MTFEFLLRLLHLRGHDLVGDCEFVQPIDVLQRKAQQSQQTTLVKIMRNV